MKNKILALLATIGLLSSVSAVEINDNLSIGGFIDGSYYDADAANGEKSFDLDEIELQFDANVGNVSGSVHIDNVNQAGNDVLNIEQAHFTYSLDNGLSFTFGTFGSNLGLEGEDPAGLYTFSRAYSVDTDFNLGNTDAITYSGLTIAYAADVYSIAVSINENGTLGSTDDDLDFEISASYTGFDNLVLGGGYYVDNGQPNAERDIANIHASYTIGKALIAGEIVSADDANIANGEDAYLVLIDYDFTDKIGGALRYSEYELTSTTEGEKLTIAPNYSITESLGAIVEFSKIEEAGVDTDEVAVELTYTF